MAISDLFTPFTIMPFIIAKTLSDGAFLKQIPSPLAGIVCKFCFFLADTSIVVSIISLLMISLDRLIAVVFPLQVTAHLEESAFDMHPHVMGCGLVCLWFLF